MSQPPTPTDVQLLRIFPALRGLGQRTRLPSIPVVQQTTVADCGAACLCMALAHHGHHVTLNDVRRTLAVGRDGVTARAILECARFYGLSGRGVRIEPEALARLPRASILHWNFAHFVLLDRADSHKLQIIDPAEGRRTCSLQEAGEAFTGVALILEKSATFTASAPGENPVRTHLRRIIHESSEWHRIALVSILLQLLSLLFPVLSGGLVDRVIPRADMHLFGVLLAGLATAVGFQLLSRITRGQLLLQLRTCFDAKMTFGFMERLLRLPYDFFERRHPGDLQLRVASVAVIREDLTGAVLTGLIDGIMVLSHLFFLAFISLKITAIAGIVVAIQLAVHLATRSQLEDLAAANISKESDAANALNELLLGMESLKASGCEHRASQTWAARQIDMMNLELRKGSLENLSESLLDTLHVLGPVIILMVGALDVMAHSMTLGTLLAAEALAAGFLDPVLELVATLQSLQTTRAHLSRIDDVLGAAPEQQADSSRMLAPKLRGHIALDRVSFRYGPQLPAAVQSLSVVIEPGQSVAIVGRSGSGKTTLGRLLLGLYQPSEGNIALDGLPLSQLDLGSVRRQLGVVVQKPHVFGSTIRGNIALSDLELPLPQVIEAAQRACIHEDIMRMPMQYDTPVVAGGSSLSGGQRQRIALARALVHEPAILLLDEATSALDAVTEAQVRDALDALHCTRLVIAHRLSTVMGADLILVMHDGALVESGTHEALMRRRGVYAELVAAQLADHPPGGSNAQDTPAARTVSAEQAHATTQAAPQRASPPHLAPARRGAERASPLWTAPPAVSRAGGATEQTLRHPAMVPRPESAPLDAIGAGPALQPAPIVRVSNPAAATATCSSHTMRLFARAPAGQQSAPALNPARAQTDTKEQVP